MIDPSPAYRAMGEVVAECEETIDKLRTELDDCRNDSA